MHDGAGCWQTSKEGIEDIVIDYFEKIFTAGRPDLVAQETILQAVQPRVTAAMNIGLCAPYTMEEIKKALFQMHPSKAKAPGPDGMSPFFFQKYWDMVGVDVSNAVIHFLTTREMPHNLNFTHVVLIPKSKEPQDMSQLRPIALCNVIYKIASKVLANRLKVFLTDIISPQQSVFVPDRLISDNTLVASELAHFIHNLRRGKEGFLALKLDISMAYDRLEWHFLWGILSHMGFDSDWIELIMDCLSSVRYSFIINGEPRGFVTPSKGLRQGDPLSPYLFILCAEGLSALITQFVTNGQLKGLQVCEGAPTISHLLFADDSLLYTQATPHDCLILSTYERASGQQINL